ncbi:MAG TPA: hypothetical protein PLL10_03060, partial [Elusimicrobiales bacterium]|nr:hypothetical protein [Elusimicrobiales bacterium]
MESSSVPASFHWLVAASLCGLLLVYVAVGFLGYGRRAEFSAMADQALAQAEKIKEEAKKAAEKAKEEEDRKKRQQLEPPAPPQEKKLELRGDKEFRDKVLSALLVIYTKDAKAYRLFRNTISVVAPGKEDSRYESVGGVPTLFLAPADVNKSVSWCAGTIARIFALAYQQASYAYKARVVLKAPPPPGQEGKGEDMTPVAPKPFDYEEARKKAISYQIKIMRLAGSSVQELNEFNTLVQQYNSNAAQPNIPFASAASAELAVS